MNEEITRGNALRALTLIQGYKHLENHIDSEIREGWEKFIALPAEKKTSKAAYHFQAKYEVLKDLKEWINESIRHGDQANEVLKKERERAEIEATTY